MARTSKPTRKKKMIEPEKNVSSSVLLPVSEVKIWDSFIPLVFFVSYMFAYTLSVPLKDGDPYWHLMAGDLILNVGKIPLTDTWSYTADGAPWYNLSWLYDILISIVFKFFGIGGLIHSQAMIIGLVMVTAYIHLKLRRVSIRTIIASLVILNLCLTTRLSPRPETLSYLFVAWFHLNLFLYSQSGKRTHLYVLPWLMILWANIHGSFLTGGSLIFMYFAIALYEKNTEQARVFFFTGIACGLAILVNPLGWGIFPGAGRTLFSYATQVILEYRNLLPFASVSAGVAFSILFITSDFRDKSIPLVDKILTIFWICLALGASRHFYTFIILCLPYLALRINSFPHDQSLDFQGKMESPLIRKRAWLASIVCTLLFMQFGYLTAPQNTKFGTPEDLQDTVNYLVENHPGARVYNLYTDGGYFIYQSKGKLLVTIDGRAGTAYPESLIEDFFKLKDIEAFKGFTEKYPFEYAAVSKERDVFALFERSAEFKKEKEFGDYIVFARVKPKHL